MLANVEQRRFGSRIATDHLSVSGSARRLRWAQVNVSNVAEPVKRAVEEKGHRGHMVNRLRRRPVERVQRARKEKECRVRRLSRSSHSSGSKVPRLPQPITARDMASRKAETRDNQKERHRHGRNNFSVTNTSGSGM